MSDLEIASIAFEEGGLSIQYMEIPTDVRARGRLVKQHQLQLSAAHPDYREDMEKLYSRAKKVLRNALEDFEESEPYLPPTEEDDDEDDDRGMGDR